MSVHVQFDPWGRMGNRMFQYAFGYILAKQKNTNLFAPELPNFNIQSTTVAVPTSNVIFTKTYGVHYVDWKDLISTTKDVIVNSFLQKAKYYLPFKQELKNLFQVNSSNIINKNKLVVHIRETDYCQLNWFLGYDYYKKIITDSEYKEVVIVTDNSNCETVQRLLSEGCVLNTIGSINNFNVVNDLRTMEDFNTLLYSSNIVLSPSSFSWWAAFLGNHERIIFPTTVNGPWKETPDRDDIDLIF